MKRCFPPRFVVAQLCVPDYRESFYNQLARQASLKVLAGAEYFKQSIKTVATEATWLVGAKNQFWFDRRFAWQDRRWADFEGVDVFVHELNPRIVSLWRDLLYCKLRGVKFVFWGHAWGKNGPHGLAFRFRHGIARLANGMICYTETQAELTRRMNRGLLVIAAPNACLSRVECKSAGDESTRDAVIYVGRLVKEKKVALLVEGFAQACRKDPAFAGRLIVVGDGPERTSLEHLAERLGIVRRVAWLGHQSDVTILRRAYEQCFVSVSPGYVGLSLTQSFAFGVPALIAKNEPHSPEIEAARDGWNAHFFESDNCASLGDSLLRAWHEWRGIKNHRDKLSAWTATAYSFEAMADRFVELAFFLSKKDAQKSEQPACNR